MILRKYWEKNISVRAFRAILIPEKKRKAEKRLFFDQLFCKGVGKYKVV